MDYSLAHSLLAPVCVYRRKQLDFVSNEKKTEHTQKKKKWFSMKRNKKNERRIIDSMPRYAVAVFFLIDMVNYSLQCILIWMSWHKYAHATICQTKINQPTKNFHPLNIGRKLQNFFFVPCVPSFFSRFKILFFHEENRTHNIFA